MPLESSPPHNHALTTWKDIAQYFERDVRTVQRWEKEEGLPVHRHVHHRKSSVYAYPEELRQWWQERGTLLAESREVSKSPGLLRPILWGAVSLTVVLAGLIVWLKVPGSPRTQASGGFRTVKLEGTLSNGNLGHALAGDVNGDGISDLVLSAAPARGIYVIFGSSPMSSGGELPAAASVVITGSNNGWLGAMQVGDFNGDGIQDILISHVLSEPESYRATGKSYVLWGRRQWPQSLLLPDAADVTLNLEWPTDARMSGCNVQGARLDLNGDGIDDVLLGAPEYGFEENRSSGAIFVLFGRRQWPREVEVASAASVTIRGSRTGEGFAGPCALGDFNGDGRTDLAAFAGEDTLWSLLGSRGKLFVFEGRKAWPRRLNAGTDFDFRLEGQRRSAVAPFATLADLNGDGFDDLITGWPIIGDDAKYPGEARVWFGRADRRGTESAASPDLVIVGSGPGAQFGSAMVSGDFDGDGQRDLIVSEPGTGKVYLLYGRREWRKSGHIGDYAPVVVFHGEAGAGAWHMALADLDGDQLPELVFDARYANGKQEQAGRAWILKPYLPVGLDVRPGSEPNVILQPGVCVARILGSSRNPRDQIDPSTMRLAGAPPTRYIERDFNGDGIPDWQVYFDSSAMKINTETRLVVFSARTQASLPVAGTDTVLVLPQASSHAPRAARDPG